MRVEIPSQNRKKTTTELAQKYGLHPRTIARHLKEMGVTKSREEYEQHAKDRRRIAYELRQSGLKWAEVAEKMGVSVGNAKVLGSRYKQSIPQE